ncbi:glycosyltransferase family 8 protein [Marinomonas sp. M1K-6]|uniref:Glycosyltransferase family 8 protein n=1 Tax=Marinomonas profundi TaxID=2726122 RepID=A0A847R9F8_9GAMM|nr:glycosyltransferase family 8 protein [Marinomonas profundi]NLQ19083.1 glycosyltransferase family 8 protein [Marinomonas profundi]UDV04227.1 glycosyltransferase family 8 protein [Marinomonas profundi]
MINIVLCSDENYAAYSATVMISSLLNTTSPEKFAFYLLTPGLKIETEKKLKKAIQDYDAQLHIVNVDTSNLNSLNIHLGRFGIGALLRLYMHFYLPEHVEKVIYLDCDLLVLGDLADLWKKNLNGLPVGAVTDLCSPEVFKKRHESYFNSGVLLIDLIKWKKDQIGEKSLSYLNENSKNLKYPDQDALNYILKDKYQPVDLSWNVQPTSYSAYEKNYDYLQKRKDELYQSIKKSNIIHFIGSLKPWHPNCTHPMQELFIDFSKHTPWPIDIKKLRTTLSISEKIRLILKKKKIQRRRKMTEYKKNSIT